MKAFLLVLVASIAPGASMARADDVADARKAFETFVLYSHTNDEHMVDLFADDVSVTFTYDTPNGARDRVLPPSAFKEAVKKGIVKKNENADTYEAIEAVQEGETVRLTCTRTNAQSGEKSPMVTVYGRDAAGALKIKAMKMKVTPPKMKTGEQQ